MRDRAAGQTQSSRPARGRARVFAFATAVLVLAPVTAVQAQSDPYATVEQHARQNDLDTDLTPVAKKTELWTLVHGAEFPNATVIDRSVTSFDTDLFAVSFRGRSIGLAGGSGCPTSPVRKPSESDAEYGQRVADCEGQDGSKTARIPQLYRYIEPPDGAPRWERLQLPGIERPGYVGAITWIDAERALIVGGTGIYPRRELGPGDTDQYGRSNTIQDPTDPRKADVAGEARAWLYTAPSKSGVSETLDEIDLSALTADGPARAGMRGLTAVGCYRDPTPGQRRHPITRLLEPDPNPDLELCFAGGLGQIWEWRNGSFNGTRVDAQSSAGNLANADLFRYRVRDIAFPLIDAAHAAAVTAGCCAANQIGNVPRVLIYDADAPRWVARSLVHGRGELNEAAAEWPDSFYSLTVKWEREDITSYFNASVIASAGGVAGQGERSSVISQTYTLSPARTDSKAISLNRTSDVSSPIDLAHTPLSTARLVAGAGDNWRSPSTGSIARIGTERIATGGDGIPDWAVGELRSTYRSGLGARGLVVATARPPTILDAVNEGRGATPPSIDEVVEREWDPVSAETLAAYIESRHYLLPSYSANAIDIVGVEEDGWAVGDHGAILRFSAAASRDAANAAEEPKPPNLGRKSEQQLSDRSAYDGTARVANVAGSVPPVGTETVQVDEPQMVPSGDSGVQEVETIVMSRDGSDGWALGSRGSGITLSRFDGVKWRSCDPYGVTGVVPPDPECEDMATVRSTLTANTFDTAIRVPLELDENPSNDDEFEVIALAEERMTNGAPRKVVISYRRGRWSIDPKHPLASAVPAAWVVSSVAMTDRTELWVAANNNNAEQALFYFNGDRWIRCDSEPQPCGDPAKRLPPSKGKIRTFDVFAAGRRVYLYGRRILGTSASSANAVTEREAPMIVYHDPDGLWTDGSAAGEEHGGFDPGFTNPATQEAGRVRSLSVVEHPDGGFEGWAVGKFGPTGRSADSANTPLEAALMRLDGDGWRRFNSRGAFDDYMLETLNAVAFSRPWDGLKRLQVTYPSSQNPDAVFIGEPSGARSGGRIFGFDGARQRFELLDTARNQGLARPWQLGPRGAFPDGELQAMAPDGRGGFWAAVSGYMFHYTTEIPKQVFEDVPNPVGIRGARIRDIAGGPDGSVWAATASDRIFRYDRVAGWEDFSVPGWEPGGVVTRASAANAVAVGPENEGLVVGEGGRIVNLTADGVALDPAAGTSCAKGDLPPCSTSRDLTAVDIAPDGSALVLGERRTVLWRPAGGAFDSVDPPPLAPSIRMSAVSYATPTRAYIATDSGQVFRGDLDPTGDWRWQRERALDGRETLAADENQVPIPVTDIVISPTGHGYAVGEDGLVLGRRESGWRRLPSPYQNDLNDRNDLTAVEYAPGGDAVLIGGERGVIFTGSGEQLTPARLGDFPRSDLGGGTGTIIGFAYLPGSEDGSVDAWAAFTGSAASIGADRLLRYRSNLDDSLLDAPSAVQPLPDTEVPNPGELAIAAFGKSDCDYPESNLCPEMTATTTTNEAILERIVDELAELRERGALDLAVLSGDATDSAGHAGSSLGDLNRVGDTSFGPSEAQMSGQLKHRRFAELVANELTDRGIPFFAAIGGQDLTETFLCDPFNRDCETVKPYANAGENFGWREAFAGQAAPWGSGADSFDIDGEVELVEARGSIDNAIPLEDQKLDDPTDAVSELALPETELPRDPIPPGADLFGLNGAAPDRTGGTAGGQEYAGDRVIAIGGASTHYAIDAIRDGEAVARVVFVDTSLGSLAASDPLQQPQEIGGQQKFLERMICKRGQLTSTGETCTREPGQAAIVVSNTPTYSYGPGALTHTATDATTFESLMLRHDVDLVISGALGYNGLYYTLAPGLHEPCPNEEHPSSPPDGLPSCAAAAGAGLASLEEQGVPDATVLLEEQGLAGAYPTLIASGAGGKFGPDGRETPDGPGGMWHGYSMARIQPDGGVIVEQRPILDWIGLDAADHVVEPRAKLKLKGYGRSPLSTPTDPENAANLRAFHYEISNAAITHRYDLLLADPDEPWLPCKAGDAECVSLHSKLSSSSSRAVSAQSVVRAEESGTGRPCDPYLCLPERIGSVDRWSGEVRAGNGKYPDAFAVAMLSVGDKVATWPLVFKRSPSFVVEPVALPAPIPAAPTSSGAAPAPPAPPNPPTPNVPQASVPAQPSVPPIAPLSAAQPPEPQPPAPPLPPPPSEAPAPLSLAIAPPGIAIATPTAVIQPPTPPVNPAPPGGARREARQRQAAAQKSGADSEEQAHGDARDYAGDQVQGRASPDQAFRRRAQTRPDPSFTPLARADQPSAWTQGALYSGGIALMAFALAAGFSRTRPTPRGRSPELAAPATARASTSRDA